MELFSPLIRALLALSVWFAVIPAPVKAAEEPPVSAAPTVLRLKLPNGTLYRADALKKIPLRVKSDVAGEVQVSTTIFPYPQLLWFASTKEGPSVKVSLTGGSLETAFDLGIDESSLPESGRQRWLVRAEHNSLTTEIAFTVEAGQPVLLPMFLVLLFAAIFLLVHHALDARLEQRSVRSRLSSLTRRLDALHQGAGLTGSFGVAVLRLQTERLINGLMRQPGFSPISAADWKRIEAMERYLSVLENAAQAFPGAERDLPHWQRERLLRRFSLKYGQFDVRTGNESTLAGLESAVKEDLNWIDPVEGRKRRDAELVKFAQGVLDTAVVREEPGKTLRRTLLEQLQRHSKDEVQINNLAIELVLAQEYPCLFEDEWQPGGGQIAELLAYAEKKFMKHICGSIELRLRPGRPIPGSAVEASIVPKRDAIAVQHFLWGRKLSINWEMNDRELAVSGPSAAWPWVNEAEGVSNSQSVAVHVKHASGSEWVKRLQVAAAAAADEQAQAVFDAGQLSKEYSSVVLASGVLVYLIVAAGSQQSYLTMFTWIALVTWIVHRSLHPFYQHSLPSSASATAATADNEAADSSGTTASTGKGEQQA